jgi:hypothetical protein
MIQMRVKKMRSKLIYLATPYTHENNEVMERRYEAVTHTLGALLEHGQAAYSPITHCRKVQQMGYCDEWTEDDWLGFDKNFLDHCDTVLILGLPGWKSSPGVTWEIAYAEEHDLPHYILDAGNFIPEDLLEWLEENS